MFTFGSITSSELFHLISITCNAYYSYQTSWSTSHTCLHKRFANLKKQPH